MNIFNKPYKTKSEKELAIKTIIENICQKAYTKILIDPSQNNIFIKDEEKHLDVVINKSVAPTSFSVGYKLC